MELHSYYLFYPLDWEFCFLSVDDYKSKIRDNFYKNEDYNKRIGNELDKIYTKIDEILSEAKKQFIITFSGFDQKLRCPPMIFPIPTGNNKNEATFCVILKCNDDGDTFVYSPVPLPYLEQNI